MLMGHHSIAIRGAGKSMNRTTDKIIALLGRWLHEQTSKINSNSVIKDILSEVEITTGYFFVLTVANLIALCGLIMNSSPVIIGAMLISPLMGPILSFGFAFVTGDNAIWGKSVKKITLSVALSVVVAAAATFISPLNDVTSEILARTRPNLSDLIVAFLAGTAGASALCTKKNYLTVVSGVAIATAVIPPLSVAGFGAGIADLKIFYGGLLLFFTNFVAIVLSTCAVFSFYGFRRRMTAEIELSQMKKRFAFLITVLIIISIPLIYTLQSSIAEVRQRSAIRNALQQTLEKEKSSHLTTFHYAVTSDGILDINAQVNTVRYLSEDDIKKAESTLALKLGRKVVLNMEQVRVQVGGLTAELPKGLLPAAVTPKTPGEVVRDSGERVRSVLRTWLQKTDKIIAPSKVTDFTVGFSNRSAAVLINLKIRRDTPLGEEQALWIKRLLASDLNIPVDLKVETIPFLPVLRFKPGDSEPTEEMKKEVMTLKDIYRENQGIVLRVEAFVAGAGRKEKLIAKKRAQRLADILVNGCGVPPAHIKIVSGSKSTQSQTVRISVITGQPVSGS